MTRRRPQSCARPTGFAPLGGLRDSDAGVDERSSTHTNNQHGMGPVQGSALGPLQVAAPSHGARTLPGLRERILQRFLCLAAAITLNHQLARPSRALVNYCA